MELSSVAIAAMTAKLFLKSLKIRSPTR